MQRAVFNPIRIILLTITATTVLHGCSEPEPPTESVRAYWDAIQQSDWQTAWAMEHANVAGTDDPYHYYQRMKRAWPVMDFELGAPVVDGREAEVSVELTRGIPILDLSLPKPRTAVDRWVWDDGRWWHVEADEIPAPAAKPAADEAGGQAQAGPANHAGSVDGADASEDALSENQ